jgi:pimeloyl-ACP methyl ester carboxylesterase
MSNGTNTSFGQLQQIDAGLLNVGYAEAGPTDGPAVMLLHGWPYDIHSYVDVAPRLAQAGYRVIVPYLRGYGTTRFLSSETFRNGQQSVVALDSIALLDALGIEQAILGGFDWGARTEHFASSGGAVLDKRRVYAAPARLRLNHWALAGDWTVGRESTVLNTANGRIAYRFHARDLHLVMGPATRGTSVRFRVFLDGQAPGEAFGTDVDDQGSGTVTEQRLYQLIRQPWHIADRQFEIEFLDAGVEAFVLTFG